MNACSPRPRASLTWSSWCRPSHIRRCGRPRCRPWAARSGTWVTLEDSPTAIFLYRLIQKGFHAVSHALDKNPSRAASGGGKAGVLSCLSLNCLNYNTPEMGCFGLPPFGFSSGPKRVRSEEKYFCLGFPLTPKRVPSKRHPVEHAGFWEARMQEIDSERWAHVDSHLKLLPNGCVVLTHCATKRWD